ncbi:MAG: hypothetical protein GWN86_10560 [Desulfobacterales bacterium]|nr:hypothetical protein [Desulfobacterales bacterium]
MEENPEDRMRIIGPDTKPEDIKPPFRYSFTEDDYEKVVRLARKFKGQVWREWGNMRQLIADFSDKQLPLLFPPEWQ